MPTASYDDGMPAPVSKQMAITHQRQRSYTSAGGSLNRMSQPPLPPILPQSQEMGFRSGYNTAGSTPGLHFRRPYNPNYHPSPSYSGDYRFDSCPSPMSMSAVSVGRDPSLGGSSEPKLEALATGPYFGRAGAIVAFLLTFEVKHRQYILDKDADLTHEKKKLLRRKGGAVFAQWPVVYDGYIALIELEPTLRYLAKKNGLYGSFAHSEQAEKRDYLADLIMEKLSFWRDSLSDAIGERGDKILVPDPAAAQGYLKTDRNAYLEMFETYLDWHNTDYFTGEEVNWVDPAIFSVLCDDQILCLEVQKREGIRSTETTASDSSTAVPSNKPTRFLERYPRLRDFYGRFSEQRNIRAWLEEHYRQFRLPIDWPLPPSIGHGSEYGSSVSGYNQGNPNVTYVGGLPLPAAVYSNAPSSYGGQSNPGNGFPSYGGGGGGGSSGIYCPAGSTYGGRLN